MVRNTSPPARDDSFQSPEVLYRPSVRVSITAEQSPFSRAYLVVHTIYFFSLWDHCDSSWRINYLCQPVSIPSFRFEFVSCELCELCVCVCAHARSRAHTHRCTHTYVHMYVEARGGYWELFSITLPSNTLSPPGGAVQESCEVFR